MIEGGRDDDKSMAAGRLSSSSQFYNRVQQTMGVFHTYRPIVLVQALSNP